MNLSESMTAQKHNETIDSDSDNSEERIMIEEEFLEPIQECEDDKPEYTTY